MKNLFTFQPLGVHKSRFIYQVTGEPGNRTLPTITNMTHAEHQAQLENNKAEVEALNALTGERMNLLNSIDPLAAQNSHPNFYAGFGKPGKESAGLYVGGAYNFKTGNMSHTAGTNLQITEIKDGNDEKTVANLGLKYQTNWKANDNLTVMGGAALEIDPSASPNPGLQLQAGAMYKINDRFSPYAVAGLSNRIVMPRTVELGSTIQLNKKIKMLAALGADWKSKYELVDTTTYTTTGTGVDMETGAAIDDPYQTTIDYSSDIQRTFNANPYARIQFEYQDLGSISAFAGLQTNISQSGTEAVVGVRYNFGKKKKQGGSAD